MQYILVENKQIVHLGPIFWRHRFIQSELEDLDVDYIVSPTDPEGYVKINDSFEIYPVELETPSYDSTYQQLAGPFWTFENNIASGTYTVVDRELDVIKNDLKALTASERYKKEIAGVKVTVQNTEVTVDTARGSRDIFVQKFGLMVEGDTVNWKFPEAWLLLTKNDLGTIVAAGASHVQASFDWEARIVVEIDTAETIDALKNIVIVEKTDIGAM